jgi:hypothetical protein
MDNGDSQENHAIEASNTTQRQPGFFELKCLSQYIELKIKKGASARDKPVHDLK